MKTKIYLDIDGVLLDNKTGKPAEHAEELIMFLTSGKYDCYWLTTHCKGDPQTALDHLSGHFSEKVMKRLARIKPTQWTDMKTEAIDMQSDFIWLEGYPFQAEISQLYKCQRYESLYKVDLSREDELLNAIDFIKKHGKKRFEWPHLKKPWMKKALVAAIILAALYAIPGVRMLLWRISSRPTDYVKTVTIPADRGKIFDASDNVIATNKTVYDLHMDCMVVQDQRVWEEKSRRLAQEIALILPEKTAPQWWDTFQEARKNRRRYIPIVKNADHSLIDSLCALPLFNEGQFKGGRIVTAKTLREYPYGNLARRTIGAWRPNGEDPTFGLEAQLEGDLNGDDGFRNIKVGYRGRRERQWETKSKDEIDGWNIYTTLDMRKQAVADSLLRAAVESDEDIAGGCLALMEVSTGKVVTLANIHRLNSGTVGEYYNYMLNHNYEPGEVAQTITLAAALSDGIIKSLDEKIPTNHGRLSDTSAVRDDYIRRYERKTQADSISVIEGFSSSSRYVSSYLAGRYQESIDYYCQWYKSFLIGRYNFDIYMNDPDLVDPIARDINTIAAMANGYEFTLCPMQVLAFYNTIANEGRLMEPMLIEYMDNDEYGAQYMHPKELEERGVRKEVADSVRKALSLCVENGTARILEGMPQHVVGKTGTACQIIDPNDRGGSNDPYSDSQGRKQYASTFAGFYPATYPQYSVICVLYTNPTKTPIHGGQIPTQIVKQFVEGIEGLR